MLIGEVVGDQLAGYCHRVGWRRQQVLTTVVRVAIEAENLFKATCLAPSTALVMSQLADLEPRTLALMHGSSFTGDGGGALRNLAVAYDERFLAST